MTQRGSDLAAAGAAMLAFLAAGCGVTLWKPAASGADPYRAYMDAMATLRQAAEDPDPVTRSNAIEALSRTVGAEAGPLFQQSLSDPYPSVRFAAAMAMGDVGYQPALAQLRQMAGHDRASSQAEPDKRVFCAVIYAMHKMGDTTFTGELGSLLMDQEQEVRADAAMVMGRMHEPSGITPLKVQLDQEQDPSVQLQLLESLALLGDEQSAIRMEAHTKTQYMEDRLVAIAAMEQGEPSRARIVLAHLVSEKQPPRVRVAAAGTLAKLGQTNRDLYKLASRAAQDPDAVMSKAGTTQEPPTQFEVRSLQRLAAIALGWMDRQEAVDILRPLLNSQDGGVKVASAMSIVRLLKAYRPVSPAVAEKAEQEQAGQAEQAESKPAQPSSRPAMQLHTAEGKD